MCIFNLENHGKNKLHINWFSRRISEPSTVSSPKQKQNTWYTSGTDWGMKQKINPTSSQSQNFQSSESDFQ